MGQALALHQLRGLKSGAREAGGASAPAAPHLVDIREGDALDTLKDVGSDVDLLLVDGALALYLPALKLIEPG